MDRFPASFASAIGHDGDCDAWMGAMTMADRVMHGECRHGEYKVPGGKLVVVDFTVIDGRFTGMQVSGDFFLEPDSTLDRIDAALEGLSIDTDQAALAAAVLSALGPEVRLFGISPEAVAVALRRALDATGEAADAGGTA